jgi:hypothetical protein
MFPNVICLCSSIFFSVVEACFEQPPGYNCIGARELEGSACMRFCRCTAVDTCCTLGVQHEHTRHLHGSVLSALCPDGPKYF